MTQQASYFDSISVDGCRQAEGPPFGILGVRVQVQVAVACTLNLWEPL